MYLRVLIPAVLAIFSVSRSGAQVITQTFNCTGASQNFVVPACVSTVTIQAWGAGGGGGGWDTYGGSPGGGGAYSSGVLNVTPGQNLTIVVGCGGQPGANCVAGNGFGPGGFGLGNGGNGGNPGATGCSGAGGGGGGGTGVMSGAAVLLVAGGGGGGGGGGNYGGGAAGGGGGQNGFSVGTTQGGLTSASPNTNGLAGASTVGDGAGGGGGGGGLNGGGGGNVPGTDQGGAGGAGGTSLGTTVQNGAGTIPGNSGSALLCAGCAAGGNGAPYGGAASAGGPGRLVLSYTNVTPPSVTINTSANPICSGNSVVLTASGATTYTWTGGVTNGVAFTPASTSGYTVTGTSGACTSTAAVTVTVNPLPVIAVNSSTLCAGQQTVVLNASGAATYNWAPSAGLSSNTGASVNANPIATTVYTVLGTSAANCTSTAQSTVTVVNASPITVNSAAICAGQQSATLSANGATSYTWSPAAGLSSSTGSTVVASPAATTVYTVIAQNANGCFSGQTSTVTVNPIPAVTASSATICVSSTASLSASGASTYSWSPGLSSSSGASVTGSPATTASYTVTGSSVNGCTASAVSTIFVNPLPLITVNSASICLGQQTATLTAGGAASYTWSPPGGLSSNTGATVLANPSSTTVYTVTGTDANGCSASQAGTVTVNPLPVIAVNSAAICVGQQTATLSASGANTYSWIPAASLSSANGGTVYATPGTTTTYTVGGTDLNGCISASTGTVTVHPLPVITVNSAAICAGQQTAQLNANGAVSYSWNPATGLNTSNGSNVNANPSSTTVYTVAGTDANTCTNVATSTVTVNPLPVVNVNSAAICIGQQTAALSASGANSYAWSPPGGLNSITGPNVQASPGVTTVYTVTGTSLNLCSNTATSLVQVLPLPPIVSGQTLTGCAPFCASFTNAATVPATYLWQFGDGGSSSLFEPNHCFAAGSYTVKLTATDANGCVNTASSQVIAHVVPRADFYFSPAKPMISSASEVTFKDASTGANLAAWEWYFLPENTVLSTEKDPVYTYEKPGTYLTVLIVTSEFGCRDTAMKPIVVDEDFELYVPNAFTPNGDGLNDTFQPKGLGFTSYHLRVFNRWGQMIFESNDISAAWDGTFKSSEPCANDTYVWMINVRTNDGRNRELLGHVTLLR